MKVNKRIFEKSWVKLERLCCAGNVAVCDLRRFLHHATELPCLLESATLPGHGSRLDAERGSAQRRPGQTIDHTQALLRCLFLEDGRAEPLVNQFKG